LRRLADSSAVIPGDLIDAVARCLSRSVLTPGGGSRYVVAALSEVALQIRARNEAVSAAEAHQARAANHLFDAARAQT